MSPGFFKKGQTTNISNQSAGRTKNHGKPYAREGGKNEGQGM